MDILILLEIYLISLWRWASYLCCDLQNKKIFKWDLIIFRSCVKFSGITFAVFVFFILHIVPNRFRQFSKPFFFFFWKGFGKIFFLKNQNRPFFWLRNGLRLRLKPKNGQDMLTVRKKINNIIKLYYYKILWLLLVLNEKQYG